MVQETAIAEGTNVMFSEEANDSITDLEQVGAHIDNLGEACTSTSSSGGTKRRSRRSRSRRRSRRRRRRRNIISRRNRRRSKRNKRRRRNKTKKMRGGVFDEPAQPQSQLRPLIFTEMYKYIRRIKNPTITPPESEVELTADEVAQAEITEKDLVEFIKPQITTIEKNGKIINSINYKKLCIDLFEMNEGKKYKIENIDPRLDKDSMRLLFMNFKSHNIFSTKNRTSLFEIIEKTEPEYICFTEALVPNAIALKVQEENNKHGYGTYDAIIHTLSDYSAKDTVTQPNNAYEKFKKNKQDGHRREKEKQTELGIGIDIDNSFNKTLTGQWIKNFIKMGYLYIIFGNPINCPYGINWGNCIITKQEPTSAKILQMQHKKTYNDDDSFQANKGETESRCMIHIVMTKEGKEGIEHNILCTHLEDTQSDIRINQTSEIQEYIRLNGLDSSSDKIKTLVGDLNAIYKGSYNATELQLLNKLNGLNGGGDIPSDAVDTLNTLLGEALLINKGQQYESLFQKCVSHAYSNFYKKSLMIFTDATEFDHQPLLLVKPLSVKERVQMINRKLIELK
jgi:hypothetical protein